MVDFLDAWLPASSSHDVGMKKDYLPAIFSTNLCLSNTSHTI